MNDHTRADELAKLVNIFKKGMIELSLLNYIKKEDKNVKNRNSNSNYIFNDIIIVNTDWIHDY